MRTHISYHFCLEITYITLVQIPLAFVFNKIGIYKPPAWGMRGRFFASHMINPNIKEAETLVFSMHNFLHKFILTNGKPFESLGVIKLTVF